MRDAAMARVILADPPWTFRTRSVRGKGFSAEAWYDYRVRTFLEAHQPVTASR